MENWSQIRKVKRMENERKGKWTEKESKKKKKTNESVPPKERRVYTVSKRQSETLNKNFHDRRAERN